MIHLRLRSFSKATTDLDDAEELVVNRILVLSGLITRSLKLVNVLFSMGRSSMTSAILAILAAVVSLLVLRPDLWRFSVAGGIGFAPIYCGVVKGVFWIWPGFASCWRSTPPWGVRLFGIPLGEIAWAAGFGLYRPLFAAYVMDLRLSALMPSRLRGFIWPRESRRPWRRFARG
jgi:hypothetical protein